MCIAVTQLLRSHSQVRKGIKRVLLTHRKEAVHTSGDLFAAQRPNNKLKSNKTN